MGTDYSIIVPTNARPYCLERLLLSRRFLTTPPRQMIVGNSTADDAPAWVHQWYDRLLAAPGIRAIRLPANLGPAASRRTLIGHCATPHMLLLDDDVVITPSSSRIIDAIPSSSCDFLSAPWVRTQASDHGRFLAQDEAAGLVLDGIPVPLARSATIGFTYSLSSPDIEPGYVIKTPVTCSLDIKTTIGLDDLIPNVIARTDLFDTVNFDPQFLYYFDWYDLFMQARAAGLKCAADTGAIFHHIPEKYAHPSAVQRYSRHDDLERFHRKWKLLPLFSKGME